MEELEEIHEAAAAEANRLARGMVFNVCLIKHYYDILQAEGLPSAIIAVAIEQWCRAHNRMEVEPMLHHMFMQQHQTHEEPPNAPPA